MSARARKALDPRTLRYAARILQARARRLKAKGDDLQRQLNPQGANLYYSESYGAESASWHFQDDLARLTKPRKPAPSKKRKR